MDAASPSHFLQQAACFSVFGFGRSRCTKGGKLLATSSRVPVPLKDTLEVGERPSQNTRKGLKNDVTMSISRADYELGTAPLVDALRRTAEQDVACFHFPGHNRGKAAPPPLSQLIGGAPFVHDLPELPELDDLFSPKGVILDAQKKASELFGSSETWFLVGGTTCGIQASIMATCSPGETLILPRNSHISAISAMILSGAVPKYVFPEYNSQWDLVGGITASEVEAAIQDLEKDGKKAGAVLIVSPTYHGICSNVSEISMVCHSHGIPLLVDEAHGAHFRFHPQFPDSALELGADIAVQSTHKVLGSLTQSSMLHLSGNLVDREIISRCLQMLQSSSPSYLLLASLDAARAQLSQRQGSIFDESVALAIDARNQFREIPCVSLLNLDSFICRFPSFDPLRLTLGVWQLDVSGYGVDDFLTKEHQVICELSGSRSLTFAINLGTQKADIQRLVSGIKHLRATSLNETERQCTINECSLDPFADIIISLSPRAAFFAKKKRVRILDSIGKISGELICTYPPGIPVLVPGEVVTEAALTYLLNAKKEGAMISGASDHELTSISVCNS